MTMQDDDDKQQGQQGPKAAKGAGRSVEADAKRLRLARNLRDNLQRRKQQMRARRAGAADEASGLPAAKTDESDD
ncbi:hypothetical protein [Sinorhizobium mexicanum]|uniref:Uncharacterized protein n=1 Tax=Sinorhizobium mexicanum TaxID=375549 RepID=A0A859QBP6_9HYPH|nr:hypothetical protein [Sinorhizobium mexicanum]MBP1885890.1 hypothetical protein [Sinorhizobium mexicanum]QLL60553.1 hypothetical protein FKV68_03395 [Sinorhizobium mexicanum]